MDNKGMTLLEVLTSFFLISLSLLLMLNVHSFTILTNKKADFMRTSTYFAQEKMEKAKYLINNNQLWKIPTGEVSEGDFIYKFLIEKNNKNALYAIKLTVQNQFNEISLYTKIGTEK